MNPGDQCQSDDDFLDYARRSGQTAFHVIGTCKMGNDPMAVVDDELRVRALEGLRVVDASIMPTMVWCKECRRQVELVTRPVAWDGSAADGATRPSRSPLREQIPIAASELADRNFMRSVTRASSSPTAKAASLNRGRLITAGIAFDNA